MQARFAQRPPRFNTLPDIRVREKPQLSLRGEDHYAAILGHWHCDAGSGNRRLDLGGQCRQREAQAPGKLDRDDGDTLNKIATGEKSTDRPSAFDTKDIMVMTFKKISK